MSYVIDILEYNCMGQNEFARMLGIDRSQLSKVLRLKNKPFDSTIRLLAKGLERITGDQWHLHAQKIKEQL